MSVAVIGAGVIGLSTAVCIQENLPDLNVTTIADKFLNDTTSIIAAGQFYPKPHCAPDFETGLKWAKTSYDYFLKLASSSDGAKAGVFIISGYNISAISPKVCENLLMNKIVPDIQKLSSDKLCEIFSSKYCYGNTFTTFVCDPRYYLKYLQQKFSKKGVIIKKRVESFEDDILKPFDLIVNCTGLDGTLTNDFKLLPMRGQVIKVHAPWVKQFCLADTAYIIPGADGIVTLGGTKQQGDYNLNICEYDREKIWKMCTELMPSLKNSEICFNWVGLRPYRTSIRLEKEIINGKKVVHNYGHGESGYSFSWGTAEEATKLVKELLSNKANITSHL